MKTALIATVLTLASLTASAGCVGTGSFKRCTDASGNSYTVNQFGNTTQLNGYNAETGSNWNQTTRQMGNTTYHNGTASNGNMWNGTTTTYGNTTVHQGMDSNGNFYRKSCNQFGCN